MYKMQHVENTISGNTKIYKRQKHIQDIQYVTNSKSKKQTLLFSRLVFENIRYNIL